jgi:transposase InsO family protein
MSRKGCCYDNAAMEAFFSTLKVECVYRTRFETHRSAQREIFCYIELFISTPAPQCTWLLPRQSSKTLQTNFVTTRKAALEKHFSEGK